MRAKEGDIVRIIGNTSDHEFKIGELVRVIKVYWEGTEEENYDGERLNPIDDAWPYWAFTPDEIEER